MKKSGAKTPVRKEVTVRICECMSCPESTYQHDGPADALVCGTLRRMVPSDSIPDDCPKSDYNSIRGFGSSKGGSKVGGAFQGLFDEVERGNLDVRISSEVLHVRERVREKHLGAIERSPGSLSEIRILVLDREKYKDADDFERMMVQSEFGKIS